MKKPYQKNHRDKQLADLDKQIIWNKERKKSLQQKITQTITQTINNEEGKSKRSYQPSFSYVASIGLFLVFIVVGYTLLNPINNQTLEDPISDPTPIIQDEEEEEVQENENVEDEKTITENNEIENEKENDNKDYPHNYIGVVDHDETYYSLAMTDETFTHLIPVYVPSISIDKVSQINFAASQKLNEELMSNHELYVARSDIPLQHYEITDSHLQLYFNHNQLMNLRGSTGSLMGLFSIGTFAMNFDGDAEFYTAFGNGEPFYHFGEGFDIDSKSLNISRFYYPVKTGEHVYFAQNYNQFESIEQVLHEFLSDHMNRGNTIDLSMFYVNELELDGGTIKLMVEGDLESAVENNKMSENNVLQLLQHGIGLNIYHQKDLLEEPINNMDFYFNEEEIGNIDLSAIHPNVIDNEILNKWEPDRKFSDLTVENSTYEVINQKLIQNMNVHDIDWSPNNDMVAFTFWEEDPNSVMFLWKVGDYQPITLEEVSGYMTGYDWSPNGEYVIADTGTSYKRNGILYSVSEDAIISTIGYAFSPVWSPDSKKIAIGIENEEVKSIIEVGAGYSIDLGVYDIVTDEVSIIERGTEEYYVVPTYWDEDGNIHYRKQYFEVEKEGEDLMISVN